LAYDFKPDGAIFDPPVDMVFTYEEDDLPSGAVETYLEVHFWNGTSWEPLPSVVDPVANTVTAKIGQFGDCLFAVMWIALPPPPPPTEFTIANLSISPTTVSPGEQLTISATVSNVGDAQGTCVVELTVNGVVEATQSVTLSQNQSTTVSFTVSKDQPSTYQVELDGLAGSFTVEEGIAPPPSWLSRYWWAIVAGIALLGLLLYFLLRRRTTS